MEKIVRIILTIENMLLWHVRRKKGRIQFLTNESVKPEGNFKLIMDELKKRGIKDVEFYGVKFTGTLSSKIHYLFVCMKQLYLCRRASLVILNDNNYVISTFKPSGLKVLQIWHACGAVKKFGSQLENRQYKIRGYDKIVCCHPYWVDVFSEAFSTPKESFEVTGLPITDDLVKEQKEPDNIISYLPTFRGTSMGKLKYVSLENSEKFIASLPEGWVFQTKHHPLVPIPSTTKDKSLNQILSESKIIITDYSSIMFDASLLKDRTILVYAPDYEEYGDTVGYNIDLQSDFEGYIAKDEETLSFLINREAEKQVPNSKKIRDKYMKYVDGKNIDKVLSTIEGMMSSEK